jgi:hypothetical protein
MTRLLGIVAASIVFTLVPVGSAAAQDEMCTSPEEPTEYFCRWIGLTLVPNADEEIQEVLDRLVPGAVVLENWGQMVEAQGNVLLDPDLMYRTWHVELAEGGDAADARDILLADASVEDVALGTRGELTAPEIGAGSPTLPDTAVDGAATAPLILVGAMLMATGAFRALRLVRS